MDASYYSPLTKLYQGHLQQPSLTLDLPLLHAARPHALPPSLLVPTHTFALPQAKSSARSSLPPSSRSSHVLDCSFVPGHPSLLVCSTAPAGLVVSVDLATGQAVQSFLLPPLAEPRLDGLCSGVDPAVPLPSLARPAPSAASLSCAQMHGDPSSPLLFLGTSAGDIFAYDLRFAGRGGPRDTRGCPTLHLEGAHDGIVSAVRAGGGANTLCARSTALPSHVLISGGLQDNWIRLFDLRFPFHYSSGPPPTGGAGTAGARPRENGERCRLRETESRGTRGRVPYPTDAIQLNPACRASGAERNVFFSPSFSSRRQRLRTRRRAGDAGEDEPHVPAHGSLEVAQPEALVGDCSLSGAAELGCHCCSAVGSACGIAAMDLSPDSSLLAVAQLRAVLAEGNESDAGLRGAHSSSKQQTSFPRPSERGRGQLCPASLGGALYSSTPDAEGSVNFVRVEGPRATQGVVKEWGGGVACAPDAAVFPPRVEGFADGRHVTQAAPSRNGVAVAADCVAPVARSEANKARKSDLAWTPPTSLGAADAASSGGRSPGSATSAQARTRAKRSVWRVEGETAILSVAEGLKVVKTLAVADAAAFTSVEFSRNGKHLLMSGGATDSSFCVDCRACSCCCLCYFALRDTPAVERLKREQGVSRRATAPSARDEAGASDSSSESDGCCESACTDREREAEGASEAWKQKRADTPNIRSKVKYGLKCGVQGPDPENRPAHRAQVVNLLQSNRLSVLKSPADGALAFADAALLQHSLHSKEGNQQEPCPPSESAFHSPLSWPAADFDRVQALQFLPPFLESRLSSDSLRLRLFSPHSRLLDCRRRAFWKDPASAFPQPSRDDRQRPSAPPPARSVDTAFAMAEAAGCPAAAVSPPQGLPRENKSEPCRDSGASREGQPGASSGRPAITPFPKCHPQVSQFLSACGPLHPHWGRPSCMQERFVASLWGGLVAGVGGSRHYPGLKLWQATTGVVLSWTEGELASAEAVRCIRGHPDLSTGLLATGGALPAHTRGSISRGNGRRPNLSASVEGGLRRTRRRETEPGVTLWSLVHRDVLLEAALNREEDSNFLLVDPTDDESDC